jgi:hypothetical protein
MTRISVLLLGTYHFANPGLDAVQVQVSDVLTPEKQSEIIEIVESLSQFQPTKVAVEVNAAKMDALNQEYSNYVAGKHDLTRNEVQQFGFRLAAKFVHPRIFAIDDLGTSLPFDEALEYANQYDPEFVPKVEQYIKDMESKANDLQSTATVRQILAHYNHPDNLKSDHSFYLSFAKLGAMNTFIGAEFLTAWYDRNIRIFANLQSIATEGDRIAVFYGSGHTPILNELIRSSENMDLLDILEYL